MALTKLNKYLKKEKKELSRLTSKVDSKIYSKFQSSRKKNGDRLKDILEGAMMMYLEEKKA